MEWEDKGKLVSILNGNKNENYISDLKEFLSTNIDKFDAQSWDILFVGMDVVELEKNVELIKFIVEKAEQNQESYKLSIRALIRYEYIKLLIEDNKVEEKV